MCWLKDWYLYVLWQYRGAEALVQQAREWESSGEYARAVDCYLKITDKVTADTNILEKAWVKVSQSDSFK